MPHGPNLLGPIQRGFKALIDGETYVSERDRAASKVRQNPSVAIALRLARDAARSGTVLKKSQKSLCPNVLCFAFARGWASMRRRRRPSRPSSTRCVKHI